jgi:hypothetical protein
MFAVRLLGNAGGMLWSAKQFRRSARVLEQQQQKTAKAEHCVPKKSFINP